MPCHDPQDNSRSWDARPEPSREEVLARKMPAVLCDLATVIGEQTILDSINWKEAGVTPEEFKEWWAAHKATDEPRLLLRWTQKT